MSILYKSKTLRNCKIATLLPNRGVRLFRLYFLHRLYVNRRNEISKHRWKWFAWNTVML